MYESPTCRTKTLAPVVDDDKAFLHPARPGAWKAAGFAVRTAESVADGADGRSTKPPPAYAVVDLRLEDGNGLDVVDALHRSAGPTPASSC